MLSGPQEPDSKETRSLVELVVGRFVECSQAGRRARLNESFKHETGGQQLVQERFQRHALVVDCQRPPASGRSTLSSAQYEPPNFRQSAVGWVVETSSHPPGRRTQDAS